MAVTALNIENHFGRPQDIEFCFGGTGQLCILQSRDITNIREYGPAAGYHQVWDNSLIIDCYSGVTSPMTFSFIRNAYAEGYRILSAVMGLSGRRIAVNEELYRSMLGFFQGRVYSNLPGWYRLVKQFPVYNYAKPLIDSVTGLRGKEEFVGEIPGRSSFLRRALVEFPRMVLSVCRLSAYAVTLDLRVVLFKRRFERLMGRWGAADFGRMQPYELMQLYQEVEVQVLRKWKTPVINDLYVMLLDRLLKKYCRNWCGDDDGTLQNKLICGEGGLASSGPTRMLMQMALKIKGVDSLKYLFQTYTPEELASVVPVHPECREIAGAIRRYLQLYGFRCANELKLESLRCMRLRSSSIRCCRTISE